MKYLLDTNALIALGTNFSALSPTVQAVLTDQRNDFVLSPASLWEISIKVRLGKLDLNGLSLETFATVIRRKFGIHLLPIKQSQLLYIATLPKVKDHGDPFDLLIIAQALTENLPVLTSDGKFHLYGVNVLQ
ncbi:type II toxin-antitoxin system VapC family toxin [Hymenobacter baengnokdamensis]|uniref:type II toxin-antitoxin system VapC family toxin n=1 Tax=Hymenobacter baengnokdamensis TaxID=2615203 RepID=UPI001244155D|nr:type II toxin-antitoxin system VapC family toxin [Hymenobacter baengnokdamensis]